MKNYSKYSLRKHLLGESRTAAGSDAQYLVGKAILDLIGGAHYAQVIGKGSQAPDLTIHRLDGTKVAQVEVKSNQKHQVPMELSVYDEVAKITGYQPGGRAGQVTSPLDKDPKIKELVATMAKDRGSSASQATLASNLPIVSDGKSRPREHQISYVAYDENVHSGPEDVSRLRHRSVRANGALGPARLSNWLVGMENKAQLTEPSCPTPAAFKAAILQDVHGDDYYATKAGSEIKISSIAGTNSLIPTVQIEPSIPNYVCSSYGGGNRNTTRDVINADVHGPNALTLSSTASVPNPIPDLPIDPQTGQYSPVAGEVYYAPRGGQSTPTPIPAEEDLSQDKLPESAGRWKKLAGLI